MNDDGEDVTGLESGGNVVGTNNDARLKMLEDINDRNDRESAADFADVNDDGTTAPFTLDAAEDGEEKEEVEPEILTPEPVAEEATETPSQKIKIKVNGQELELTQEELIERAQKVESADRYLADAAKAKRAATEEPKVLQPTVEELQRIRDEEDSAIVRAIQMGTEEEAKAALRKLRDQPSTRPSVSPDDMSRAIDERLAFNEAISAFRKNYSDITDDPLLNSLAQQRDIQLIESGDTRSYAARYETIGKELRAWKEGLIPAPKETTPEVSLEAKVDKKKAAPKTPPAATKKVEQVKDDEDDGEEDASSVIAAIAKARGGPQWMRG